MVDGASRTVDSCGHWNEGKCVRAYFHRPRNSLIAHLHLSTYLSLPRNCSDERINANRSRTKNVSRKIDTPKRNHLENQPKVRRGSFVSSKPPRTKTIKTNPRIHPTGEEPENANLLQAKTQPRPSHVQTQNQRKQESPPAN